MPSAYDPSRSFRLAFRSTLILGVLSAGFGLVLLIVFGYHNRLQQFRIHFELLGTIVWLLPGVAFLLSAILMKDRRRWAVILAMITAAGQLIMALGLFASNFIFTPISAIPVVMSGLWAAALIQLLWYLRQTLYSLHLIDVANQHGFEAIAAPARVLPLEATEAEAHLNETAREK